MDMMAVNGVTLHYRLEGPENAPLVVFSNSLGTDFRVWDHFMPRLGDQFRVLRYDKRGHGLSDAPPAPYVISDHIGDLEGLMDALGLSSAIVFGLSVGGLIAQGLYATRPDLVRGLVLCDTGHKIGTDEIWNERLAAVETGGVEALADGTMERWFSPDFHRDRAEELRAWRNMLVRTTAAGYAGTGAAIRDADFTEQAKAIAVPTLCVVGAHDGATPPDAVRAAADLIPGAGYALIEDAGHIPCVEQPDELAELFLTFCRDKGLI